MKKNRMMLFVTCAVFLRLPIWALIWLIGRTGIFKTVFLIYPTEQREYANLCPSFTPLIRFLSGRPSPGGIIMKGYLPVGLYFFIPDTPAELMKKKNHALAQNIVRRMRWIQKISGAKACGFAGQLGLILEKRHNVPMQAPFFSSTMGNIFSIDDTIAHLAQTSEKKPWQLSIAILGGGELGSMLQKHLADQGYTTNLVPMMFMRREKRIKIKNPDTAAAYLDTVDFVVNLLPTGEDFLHCGINKYLQKTVTVIDFSRPPIPEDSLVCDVVMGNRVRCSGLRFALALPDWGRDELPACSLPSILAANFGITYSNSTAFCKAARSLAFSTALAAPPALSTARPPLLQQFATAWDKAGMNIRYSLQFARKKISGHAVS